MLRTILLGAAGAVVVVALLVKLRAQRRSRKINQPGGLISVLLDETAPDGDRDDAAMDLGSYDGEHVEAALARLACDPETDYSIADSCGESLAEIWGRKGHVDEAVLVRLTPVSLAIALGILEAQSPELAAEAQRTLSDHVDDANA